MDGAVMVGAGRVRGREHDGVWRFAAIPYARAPVGPLRWRPPQPPEPWAGVREVVDHGPIAPQPPPTPGTVLPGDPMRQSEDCLHLSVWTPALDGGRRPVMVWIHGGGFTSGTGGSVLYDGAAFVRHGDVVVVTVNYRLGALGFLAHPALADTGGTGLDGGWANWGLLDQIAALRWVRDHVGSFGGDPANVTVFGESAGGMSISALLATPAARGLFHRAVVQSGPPYTHSAERAVEASELVAKELGLDAITRSALEAVPAARLVEVVAELQARPPRPGELTLPLLPTVDGVTLPDEPLDAVERGAAADVALLTGTNRDELAFFALSDPGQISMDEAQLRSRLARAAPELAPDEVAAAYRTVRKGRGESLSPSEVWVAAGSDLVFRWPTLRLASAQRVHQPRTFLYLFTWVTPVLGGILGSCHALEIPFVFGTAVEPTIATYCGGSAPGAATLSAAMQASWIAFARTGDPSAGPTGDWPGWDPVARPTMLFGREVGVAGAPRNEELGVWSTEWPLAG